MKPEIDLKDAIKEWFEALTSAFAHTAAFMPASHSQQNRQSCSAPLAHAQSAMPGQFMGWFLAAGAVGVTAFYVAQSIDWSSTGVDLLLKVVSWL
jgi:hypothetical protein